MNKHGWKSWIMLLAVMVCGCFTAAVSTSCSETDEEESEFSNWQERNEAYFKQKMEQVANKMSTGQETFVLTKWSLKDSIANNLEDHIVVEVLNKGTGSGCPFYTDSVRVHFSGHLIPTTSYPDGMLIGRSYTGTFYPETARPRTMAVSSGYTPDGIATALQHMHIGDKWRIYVPHQLGYRGASHSAVSSTTASTTSMEWVMSSIVVPAYSTLIYDVQLVGYYRVGTEVPTWKGKTADGWVWE